MTPSAFRIGPWIFLYMITCLRPAKTTVLSPGPPSMGSSNTAFRSADTEPKTTPTSALSCRSYISLNSTGFTVSPLWEDDLVEPFSVSNSIWEGLLPWGTGYPLAPR